MLRLPPLSFIGFCLSVLLCAGCATSRPAPPSADAAEPTPTLSDAERDNLLRGTRNDAGRSTYEPSDVPPTVIRNATIMTAAGAQVLLRDGTNQWARGSGGS